MAVGLQVVGSLLSQYDAAERRPVVVVAEPDQDRGVRVLASKLLQRPFDHLVAFGRAVFG